MSALCLVILLQTSIDGSLDHFTVECCNHKAMGKARQWLLDNGLARVQEVANSVADKEGGKLRITDRGIAFLRAIGATKLPVEKTIWIVE